MTKFYITTPIYYVNDKPHIGHAYTTIVADTLARWRASLSEDVTFLTGVDENSQKTVDAAKKNNEEIHAYTDRMAGVWSDAWVKLGISNTDFIRTTEERHLEVVNDFWGRLEAADDLYRGRYEGLYCKGHEAFMKEDELVDGLCPDHKVAPEFVSEENYFFRLSKYQKQLLEFYDANPDFVAPAHRFNEVRSFVERGLEDVSFSREKRAWGIPVPKDPNQVIYVWADALVNYISAVGMEAWEDHPADIHVMAKDIARFHAIIWPAMLMGYGGLNLPYDVPANEFLTVENQKGSKSHNWAVWITDYLASYDPDPLRFILSINMPETSDTDFSWREFVRRNNDELVATYGNLAHRVLTLTYRNFDGKVPAPVNLDETDRLMAASCKEVFEEVDDSLYRCQFKQALNKAMALAHEANRYLDGKAPWKAIKTDRQAAANSLYTAIGAISALKTMLYPFLPFSSQKLHEYLGFEGKIENSKWEVCIPEPGQKLVEPKALFTKLDDEIIEKETRKLGH